MARSIRNPFLSRALQRSLRTLTRRALRSGTRIATQGLRSSAKRGVALSARATPVPVRAPKATPTVRRRKATAGPASGMTRGVAGLRRYRLFKPPNIARGERLPLLVMLHGCGQDAEALAVSSRMNGVAARERFVVLYPEQDRTANPQGCWNWYALRSGRAQAEAASIEAAIDQVCRLQAVDTQRIALAGLSAGASMAALLAVRAPQRYRAVAMHSGIPPGAASSTATALMAMRGQRAPSPLATLPEGVRLPVLLEIQGSADAVVAPRNGDEAVRLWGAQAGAKAGPARTVQRGRRYPSTVVDYRVAGRLVATHCLVRGLGHAWSGGTREAYSDPRGPDASRMIWAFARKAFDAV